MLVNDPQLLVPERAELIPIQRPHLQYPNIGVRDSLILALHNRPEINQSIEEIRAACLREQIATKDLLPVLDAVLATYVSGLEGNSGMGRAWVDQFGVGEPTYTLGLQFELPLGNRSARVRLLKRQLELQQFSLQLRQTVAVLVEEIEVAVCDIDAAFREAQAQYLAMNAAGTEIKYLESRWRLLPSEEQVAGIVLEDLLAAQERCGNAEIGFASAQIGYNLALANLNRATGILLKYLAEPSFNQPGAPPKDGIEEIPLPPSDVLAPLPPVMTNVPATAPGGNSTNNAPVPANANLNGVAGNVGKSPTAPLPPESFGSRKGGVEASPPPPVEALAPLPPAVTNLPATAPGGNSANNTSVQANANLNRVTGNVGKSQTAPLPTKGRRLPKGGVGASSPPLPAEALAPLPPPLTNVPATAAGTTPTQTIITR